jgi:ABC-type transport system substrate-binding protein
MRISLICTLPLALSLLLFSCKGEDHDSSGNTTSGGGNKVIRIAEVTAPSSLFPHKLTNAVEGLIASQIYEGLVKINPKDLSLLPGLAEKWEVSADGKTITFHLRKGVKFQSCGPMKNKPAEITSKDVKFTFELLCTDRPGNVQFHTVCKDRVVGANEYYEASSKGKPGDLKGFKVIDDYTFSIELLNSPNIFLQILANPVAGIINKEAYDAQKEDCNVGAGPFILDEKSTTKTHYVLYKNANYYAKDKSGNALPYIDSLIVDIVPSTEDALKGFQSGSYYLITSVPSHQLSDIFEFTIKSFTGNPPNYI